MIFRRQSVSEILSISRTWQRASQASFISEKNTSFHH